jgi:hypothetical protein
MALEITPLPTPPARSDPVNFSARADTFFLALPGFQSEANALAAEVEDNAGIASTKATEAASSASAALTSANNAAAALDAFTDQYLGNKSSDPALDNDGNTLQTGALYFNTTANDLRVYNGTSWQTASTVGGTVSSLNVTGNLGVGTTDTLGIRERVLGSSLGGGRAMLRLDGNDGVGGGGRTTYISFAGTSNDTGVVQTEFGYIGAAKRNGTQGDTQGYLVGAVNNGTTLVEAFRVLYNKNFLIDTATDTGEKLQVNGTIKGTSFTGAGTGLTGSASSFNAGSASVLQTTRTIGGVAFNGSSNIDLPGVNQAGNQNTSGNAATATALQTSRAINGTSFNGTGNITTASWGTARDVSIGGTTKSVDGSGNVTWTLAESAASIGVGQSYQNLTGSRALNTTYTNSTGRPILVTVRANTGTANDFLSLTVDSILVDTVEASATGINLTAIGIVPVGSTYVVNSSTGLTSWVELR